MQETVRCNICGSREYLLVYNACSGDIVTAQKTYKVTDHSPGMPVRIVKCRRCGLCYVNPRFMETNLIASYVHMVDETYVQEEEGRRMSSLRILLYLQRLKKNGRLLDIGCATGFFLDEARKKEWEIYGLELSEWAVDYAREKFKLENVQQGALTRGMYTDSFFDVVVMKDTIEHLVDPKSLLIEVRRILKPEGVLCITTPDIASLVSRLLRAKWWGIKHSHLYYFSRKTLCKMLDIAGFGPVKIRSHKRAFTWHYWMSCLESNNKLLYAFLKLLFVERLHKNKLVWLNLGDQIEVYAKKVRKIEYLEEFERPSAAIAMKKPRVVVVLPAYNASKTIEKTVADIPKDEVDEIILVDDASKDDTLGMARSLCLTTFAHAKNRGYGANQKTCYTKALESGADIIVMVHPDYQYDPRAIPQLIAPIKEGRVDAVFGSRMMKGGALEGGMPYWKHNANILLTALENVTFGTFLTEYHSGFRAYSAKLLKAVPYQLNNNSFIFDTEIVMQILQHHFKIEEVPIVTRYFDEASVIKFLPSVVYGLGILLAMVKYIIHNHTPIKFKQLR